MLKKLLSSFFPRDRSRETRRIGLALMRPTIGRHLEVFREVFERLDAFLSHYAPRFTVRDYSEANVSFLRGCGCTALHVPLGYAETMSRIAPAAEKDIDALFYGEVTARRAAVLDALQRTRLRVTVATDIYGEGARRADCARQGRAERAHPRRHQGARDSACFLSSRQPQSGRDREQKRRALDGDLEQAMVCAPYDSLVEACETLVADAPRRHALGEAGFSCMKKRREADIRAAALRA